MKETKLISLDKRIDQLNDLFIDRVILWTYMMRYKYFINRKLKPEYFMPWDKENNCPMEKPIKYNIVLGNKRRNPLYSKQCSKWWKAESEVLFEGFECVTNDDIHYCIQHKDLTLDWNSVDKFTNRFNEVDSDIQTISDLSGKVYLTPEGRKDSGL